MAGKYDYDEIDSVSEDDYLADGGYSSFGKSRSLNPLVLIVTILGSGILILIAIFFWFFIRPQHLPDAKEISALESRIGHLEQKLAGVESLKKQVMRLESENNQFKIVAERFDRFENSMSVRIDKLNRKAAGPTPKKISSSAPGRKKTGTMVEKPDPSPVINYHIVSQGETLYQISKRYGISVEDLLKLNQMDQSPTIHPGQKLRVRQTTGN